ncbi:MAG: type II secretion system protein [Campylobacterota bacterium]
MKRAGFTMIELIFVIVILGILAAVAIPKLAATRTDAKIAAEMTNASQVISNLGAEYVSQGAFTNITPASEGASLNCFAIAATAAELAEGNFTITSGDQGACPAPVLAGVEAKAIANGIIDAAATAKMYSFGGVGVAP